MSSLAKELERRLLGKDGFGVVQFSHDKQLRRFVAVKVPHVELVTRAEDAAPCFAAS
ncbi:MAG TPA: hypothetical protein VKE94_15050 [Gemmataceae bacterium]|nr:hypothetical protein [Gemmataceae bacterium]